MVNGFGHIAFTVMDMEKSLQFYCQVLGLENAFEVRDKNGNPWINNLKAGNGQYIELMYGGSEEYKYVEEKAGFSHLCLDVEDIYALADRLRSYGIPLDVEPKQGRDLNFQCWAKDPDGNRIEFMQFHPDSPQRKGKW